MSVTKCVLEVPFHVASLFHTFRARTPLQLYTQFCWSLNPICWWTKHRILVKIESKSHSQTQEMCMPLKLSQNDVLMCITY